MSGPTQERDDTLVLVLSYDLPVFNLEICDAAFSEHMLVLFEVVILKLNLPLLPGAVVLLPLPLLLSSRLPSVSSPPFLSLCALLRSSVHGFTPSVRLF